MKFFGGGKKKEAAPQPQQAVPQQQTLPGGMTQQQLQQQQTLAKLSKQLAESKERIDNSYIKIEKQEAKVKELISKGKRNEAKRQLMTFKMLQQELIKQENLVTTLEKAKVQLEASVETKNMIDVLKQANEIQKDIDSHRDELEDVLMDRKDLEMDQKEISNLIAELANGTEEEREEIDDLYKQYEQEVFQDKADQINQATLNTNVQPTKQHVQPQQQQQAHKQEDALEDLLQQSASYA